MITFTDKDNIEAAKVHLNKDEKVDWNIVQPTETLMNRMATRLASIFRIGEAGTTSQQDRVHNACIGRDVAPPNVSFLWKTH